MPTLTDVATWRTRPYHYKGYLYIHKPTAILSGLVDQASFTYPLSEVTYDTFTGDYLDVHAGMLVTFGSSAGGDDLGRAYIHDDGVTVDTLYLGRVSRGDKDGEVNLADNCHFTVWNLHPVFAKTPYIDPDTGTQYKFGTIPVGAGASSKAIYIPPTANIGPGYAYQTSSNVIVVDFEGAYSTFNGVSGSITHYYWQVGDGTVLTGTAGSAYPGGTGSHDLRVQFPAGFRYVYLTVTDTNGMQHTACAPVFAANTTTYKPIERFEVQAQSLAADGQTFNVLVKEAVDLSDYPDGTLVMYWEDEWYGATKGSLNGYTGREHMKFIGWIQSDQQSTAFDEDGKNAGVVLTCVDVAGRLKTLPAFNQTLVRDATANDWSEMIGANVDRYVQYLLRWHSSALEVADLILDATGDTWQFYRLNANAGTLWEQCERLCDSIDYHLTCDMRGSLHTQPDPLNQVAVLRGLTVALDLAESDWSAFGFARNRPPRVHWLWGSGIKASATEFIPYFAVSPGGAPGQGAGPQTRGQMLVTDQDDLNERIGHRYARANALYSTANLELAVAGDSGVEPAYYEAVTITQSADSAAQRGETWTSSEKWLVTGVNISHDHEAGTKAVTLEVERETSGYAAIAYTPPSADLGSNLSAQHTTFDSIEPSPAEGAFSGSDYYNLKPGIGNLALVNSDGYLYTTADWTSETPTWTRASLSVSGEVLQFVADPFSPKYAGSGSEVNGWLVTSHSNAIYRVTDLFGTPSASLQKTLTTLGSLMGRCIGVERGVQNWLIVATYYYTSGGVKVTYTTDGSTWSTESQITAGYRGGGSFQQFPGVWLSPRTAGKAIVSAYDTDNTAGRTYWTDDYGATWTWLDMVAAIPDINDVGLAGDIHVPYADNTSEMIAYHGEIDASSNLAIYRVASDGDTKTDITPLDAAEGAAYTVRAPHGIVSSELNRQKVACLGTTDNAATNGGSAVQAVLFTSTDSGDSWTERNLIVADTGASSFVRFSRQVYMSGSDSDVIYVLGDGQVWYSADFGTTILEKTGNIADMTSPTPGVFVGIAGG